MSEKTSPSNEGSEKEQAQEKLKKYEPVATKNVSTESLQEKMAATYPGFWVNSIVCEFGPENIKTGSESDSVSVSSAKRCKYDPDVFIDKDGYLVWTKLINIPEEPEKQKRIKEKREKAKIEKAEAEKQAKAEEQAEVEKQAKTIKDTTKTTDNEK